MKYTLHLRARRQHIQVEDLPLDVQLAILSLRIEGISLETDTTRTIDVEVELPSYPLSREAITLLNAKGHIHEYRAWHVTCQEGNFVTIIPPEQAAQDAKAVLA